MRCKICNGIIYTKVCWQNLFNVPKYLLCNKCSIKYIPDISVDEYELNNFKITSFSLYSKRHMIDPNFFFVEFSKFFEYIFYRYALDDFYQQDNLILIWCDYLDIIKNEEILTLLGKLTVSEIIIISTYK